MSVLVTGGAGHVGSHMVLAPCDAGHDVVVPDNLSIGVVCRETFAGVQCLTG